MTMPRKLSFDEEKAMELYKQGLNDRQIADELGVMANKNICLWRKRRGLSANVRKPDGGTRPEVTVEIPEGLKSFNERIRAEPEPEPESLPIGGNREAVDAPVLIQISRGYSLEMKAPNLELAREAARALLATVRVLLGEKDGVRDDD